VYLRLIPYFRYGSTLNEVDPYEYLWLANYFYSHDLGGLSGLSRVAFWWYPWGRDFLRSEYLGLPWLAAAIAKLTGGRVSTELALSMSPVAFTALGVVGAYLAVKATTDSRVGGLVAALGVAFMPTLALDHGFASDPAKVYIGLMIMPYPLYFLALSTRAKGRARALALAVASGASGGLIAWFWGGYQYYALIISLAALLEPFIIRPTPSRLLIYLTAWASFAAVSLTSPATPLSLFYRGVGLAPEAALIVYALEAWYDRLGLARLRLSSSYSVRVHVFMLLLLAPLAIDVLLSGLISASSRMLMGLGLSPPPTSVVPLTVQEYMGVPASQVLADLGPFFITTVIGLVALVAAAASRSWRPSGPEVVFLTAFVLSVIFTYGGANQAYYIPSAAIFTAISAGMAVAFLASQRSRTYVKKERRTVESPNWLAVGVAATLVVAVVAFSGLYAVQDAEALRLQAPALETGWTPAMTVPSGSGSRTVVPINSAWTDALSYIKENTSPGSVVVSWWDYGYWIGVLANRTTVVDGSTINGTQIGLVANAFTAPVNQSPAYLEMMRLRPNSTYILVYDVFIGIYSNRTGSVIMFPYPSFYPVNPQAGVYAITYGLGDMAKSYQMLRIALRVNPYAGSPFFSNYTSVTTYGNYEFYQFPALAGGPQANVSETLDTTIYDLMMYGVSALKQCGNITGAPFLANATSFTPAAVQYIDPTTGAIVPQPITPPSPQPYYQPVKVFASVYYAWSPAGSGVTYFYSVVVFLYRWTGVV
jgi:dolichyl-diphosphooligosaccharide--protein glycosyltransferase